MADLDKYLENLGIDVDEKSVNAQSERRNESVDEDLYTSSAPIVAAAPLEGSPKERCETFLVNLLLNIDPTYAVETRESANGDIKVGIFGGDSAKLIGKSGRTLAALEYLCNVVINRDEEDERIRVSIDVGDYKRRRDERLKGIARKAAAKVRRSGRPMQLDPMDASERRVIHLEISRQQGVASESMGEGKDRRIVIKVDNDKR